MIGGSEVFIPAVTQLTERITQRQPSNVAHMQATQLSIGLDLDSQSATSVCSIDELRGYQIWIGPDFESITRLENLVRDGNILIDTLYCFRSVSRAVPEMIIHVDESKSDAERDNELSNRRTEISRQLAEVLRPEISKIRALMKFTASVMEVFVNIILRLASASDKAPVVPEALYLSLLRLFDVLLKIDNMKDLKASLRSDFARYKRAVGSNLSNEELEDIKQLQDFLSSFDHRKARNAIILSLRERVVTIRGSEAILTELLDVAVKKFESQDALLLLPDERFGFLRAAAHLLLLIDGDPADPKSLNVFSSKWSRQPIVLKLFKRYPVVPLYADMTITLLYILDRAPHFNREAMCETWGGPGATLMSNFLQQAAAVAGGANAGANTTLQVTGTAASLPAAAPAPAAVRVPNEYDLRAQWPGIRTSFSQYTVLLAGAINHAEAHPFRKFLDGARVQQAGNAYAVCLKGLSLLSSWTSTLHLAIAWKYTHPSSRSNYTHSSSQQRVSSTATTTGGSTANQERAPDSSPTARASTVTPDGSEYEQVLRYNCTGEERTILADIISMIKSTAQLLARAEPLMAAYWRFHMHHRIQQAVQGDLLPLLHRLDKRKKPELPSLLQLRTLAADWIKGIEPSDGSDYKQYSRQRGSVTAVHPVRVVSASAAQLLLLREQIRSLYHEKSSLRGKAGVFSKADLERDDENKFEEFFLETSYFPYMIDFARTLAEVSNLGGLWYREFHLEITKCVQFPIEMSLPWILAEHTVTSHYGDIPLIEKVLFVMDIYNDAANTALHRLHQQYMYDEIEAETNLVFDQLIFLISDEAYSYFKNFTAARLLDKSYKLKWGGLEGAGTLTVGFQRGYQTLLSQKHVSLLGRSINLSYSIAHQIVEKLYHDVDVAIKRFEASDPCAVIELVQLLDILRETHEAVTASQHLEIPSFESIFHDVNETYAEEDSPVAVAGAEPGPPASSFKGRITSHMLRGLCRDVVLNFSYNAYTCRFVRSPLPSEPTEYLYQRPPKSTAVATAYGSVCHKAYEAQGALSSKFFGRQHVEAYLSLVGRGYADFETIAEECVNDIQALLTDIDAYASALIDGIPPCKPPKYMFRAGGCYGYYEGKLKSLLEFEELKPGVFQVFRELGNAIALLKEFSDAMEINDQLRRVSMSPLLGLKGNEGTLSMSLKTPASSIESTPTEESSTFPMVKAVTAYVNTTTAAAKLSSGAAAAAASNHSVSELPELAMSLGCHLWNLAALSSSSLFSNVLTRFHAMTTMSTGGGGGGKERGGERGEGMRLDLLRGRSLVTDNGHNSGANDDHGDDSTRREGGGLASLDTEQRGFHRLWSALSFLFCVPEHPVPTHTTNASNFSTTSSSAEGAAATATGASAPVPTETSSIARVSSSSSSSSSSSLYSDEDQFGHGFTLAGCILLHFLEQRTVFELSDFSRYVLQVQRHDLQGAAEQSAHASLVGKVDRLMQLETEKFVASAITQKYLQDHFFDLFAAQFPLRPPSVAAHSAASGAVVRLPLAEGEEEAERTSESSASSGYNKSIVGISGLDGGGAGKKRIVLFRPPFGSTGISS